MVYKRRFVEDDTLLNYHEGIKREPIIVTFKDKQGNLVKFKATKITQEPNKIIFIKKRGKNKY